MAKSIISFYLILAISYISSSTLEEVRIASQEVISSSTLEEVRIASQEVAYSYYMRGKYIQYNPNKDHYLSPEEVTRQNINYLVCTSFTTTVYQELLSLTIPIFPQSLLDYGRENIDNVEVIVYSYVREDGKMEMRLCDENNNCKTIINPSLDDVIPYLQVGDVLCIVGMDFLYMMLKKI